MALSKRSLLLAAACCVALSGCPKVVTVKGLVTGAPGDVLDAGESMMDGEDFTVTPGSSITIKFDNDCVRTYGPGSHQARQEDCNDQEDEEDDQDQEQDEEDRNDEDLDSDQEQDQQDQQDLDSRDKQDPGRNTQSTDATSTTSTSTGSTTSQSPGLMNTVTSTLTTTTGSIITGAIIGAVITEKINDNKEEDKVPVSP